MPKKILIIDDDPIVVKYLEAVFSDNGYETCTATSTTSSATQTRSTSQLIRRLQPFSTNIKKRLVKRPRILWRDSGLMHALMGVADLNTLYRQPWLGQSWEGFVIEQTLAALVAAWWAIRRAAARRIVESRIDSLGALEPVIQQQGADRVVVQLPGMQDTVEAKKIIGATATLEYRAVDETDDACTAWCG